MSSEPIKLPLDAVHRQWGGKMVDFAGYALPLSYAGGGLLAEHLHTRQHASIFDVSHMGQVRVDVAAAEALANLMPANVPALAEGVSKYTLLTNDRGGCIDDCIIANDGERGWFIVLNASRKEVDIAHIRAALPMPTMLQELSERALLAVQGPAAVNAVSALFPAAAELTFMRNVWCTVDGVDYRISRCGYTGEDGFEISVPVSAAAALAEQLAQQANVKPAGLGARDSLRLEAGLCLYGNELDENTSPIEAGLLWTIPKSRRQVGAFLGAADVARQIEEGGKRRLLGLLPQSRTPVRRGAILSLDGEAVGEVTSGVFSPSLEVPIALAYVQTAAATASELQADVRGKQISCRPTALPFVPHNYVK